MWLPFVVLKWLVVTAFGTAVLLALNERGVYPDQWVTPMLEWAIGARWAWYALPGLVGLVGLAAWQILHLDDRLRRVWRRPRLRRHLDDLWAEASRLHRRGQDMKQHTEEQRNAYAAEVATWKLNTQEWLSENLGEWAAEKLVDFNVYLGPNYVWHSEALGDGPHNWEINTADYMKRNLAEIKKTI